MEAQCRGDPVMAVCDAPRPGSPDDDGDDIVKFTDSDCETVVEELDTPRNERQRKLIKSPSNNVRVVSETIGSHHKKDKAVISKSEHTEQFSAVIVQNDNYDLNHRKSAFSKVKHSEEKNNKALENAATIQSNHDHNLQKHTNAASTENASGGVLKVSSNGKERSAIHLHRNSMFEDLRNVSSDALNDREIQENDRAEDIQKVTLNISNFDLPEGRDRDYLGARPRRSSTTSSSSSVRDQGSQTSTEAAGDVLQYPVSPRVSPATVARCSPRRVTSAELHRTPEQMVKQADRLIERTQAILERSAEAKRRTEVLLKTSRERRAQERLEELASYKGERLGNSNDANSNNEHRTGGSLDTNGNHENNGHDEENSNVISAAH